MIKVEERIREIIPATELRTVNHTIGVPGALNLAFVPSDNVSGADGEMLISLNKPHRPSEHYRRQLRERLEYDFPGVTFYFQTADIVSQVLNFGLPAPIDIQIQDQNFARSYEVGQRLLQMVRRIPGVVDPRITQILDFPTLADRRRPAARGAARRRQRDVANNMLASLSGSSLISPTYYLNPQNGVNYTVAVVTPVERLQSVADILNFPANPPTNNINPIIAQALPTTLPERAGDAAERHRERASRLDHEFDQPLHHPARHRRRRQCRGPRPRVGRGRDQQGDRRGAEGSAVDHQDRRCAARTRSWRTRSACSASA